MSRNKTIKAIRSEIEKLNKEIDLRIIKGLSYKDLSRRHKFLHSQLENINEFKRSWFGRSWGLVSSFIV